MILKNDGLINLSNNNTNCKRILIVDDEPYNVLGLIIMIKQIGFDSVMNLVDRAYNGLEAIERVEKLLKE